MHSRNHLHLPWSVKHKKNVWTVLISPWWTLLPRSAANIEISMWMLVFMCVVNMWTNLILYENLVWKVWVCYFLFYEILKENMIWFQLWTHIYSRTRGKIKTVQCKSDIVISRPKRLRGSSQEIPVRSHALWSQAHNVNTWPRVILRESLPGYMQQMMHGLPDENS